MMRKRIRVEKQRSWGEQRERCWVMLNREAAHLQVCEAWHHLVCRNIWSWGETSETQHPAKDSVERVHSLSSWEQKFR